MRDCIEMHQHEPGDSNNSNESEGISSRSDSPVSAPHVPTPRAPAPRSDLAVRTAAARLSSTLSSAPLPANMAPRNSAHVKREASTPASVSECIKCEHASPAVKSEEVKLPLWADSTLSDDEREHTSTSLKRSASTAVSTPAPSPTKKHVNAGTTAGAALPSVPGSPTALPTLSCPSSLSSASTETVPAPHIRQTRRMSTGGKPSAQWLAQQVHTRAVAETRVLLAQQAGPAPSVDATTVRTAVPYPTTR
ncbi:hypothetical protein DFH07DRAFT_967588 [Mycena maculata]|uniref:Uncharacterized protein n=1 Tax=Mycena maculata TaxID=230809 RepID=A0AAD7I4T0_9AGAR|nr:hypothetical protein DFH07DRAFT_967588 [Mycena maculata]